MADRDRSHAARVLRRTTSGLVLAVIVGAVVFHQQNLGERWGLIAPEPDEPAAIIEPEPRVTLPTTRTAPAVASASAPKAANPAAVRTAVQGLAGAKVLGPRAVVAVDDLGGSPIFVSGPTVVTPASTMKLLTSAAALAELGPEHRFATRVVRAGNKVTLVGGGDPLLASEIVEPGSYPAQADVATLAGLTAKALAQAGVRRVRIGYDDSLFTDPVSANWEPDYIPDSVVSPIGSLWVDEGREHDGFAKRVLNPAAAATQAFADSLQNQGIVVVGTPTKVKAPASATQIAAVQSAPLSQLVQHILETSDNEATEVLARHVAIARGAPPTFAGGAAAVTTSLRELGVDLQGAVIHDGSGLARSDRLSPATVLDVLEVAARTPKLNAVITGLPVAGFTGSLDDRFAAAPAAARGDVRAKTGTLTGVSGLAGTVVTRDGVVLTFVAIADRIKPEDTTKARAKLDQIAAALATCTCAAPAG